MFTGRGWDTLIAPGRQPPLGLCPAKDDMVSQGGDNGIGQYDGGYRGDIVAFSVSVPQCRKTTGGDLSWST